MTRSIAISVLLLSSLALVDTLPAWAQAPADSTVTPPPAAEPVKAPPPAEPEAAKPPLVLYEKAKLDVDGKAEANGSIKFSFVPEGGKAVGFSIQVLKDTGKNDIAKAIYTQLTIAAGAPYKVKVSGNQVKIERAKKENAKFSVTVEEVAIPGVSVLVKKG